MKKKKTIANHNSTVKIIFKVLTWKRKFHVKAVNKTYHRTWHLMKKNDPWPNNKNLTTEHLNELEKKKTNDNRGKFKNGSQKLKKKTIVNRNFTKFQHESW